MTGKIVIFGTGELAEIAHFYFENESGYSVAAFCVDRQYLKDDSWLGCPMVAAEDVAEQYPPAEYDAFVAIGYSGMNSLREEKYKYMKGLGYTMASFISSRATVLTHEIGDNVLLLEDNTIQPFVTIGNNVYLWSGNHIGHHSTIEDNVFIASHVVVSGGVTIGANTFIGVNATLRDQISIGPKNIIGAGAIILKSTGEDEVYPATPTRKLEGRSASSIKRI